MFLKLSVSPAAAPHRLVWQPSVNQNKPRTFAKLLIRSSAVVHDRSDKEPHMAGVARIDTLHLYTRLER